MNREILKRIIADQREYQLPQNYFKRFKSDTIRKFVDDPNILIFSGIRRSGKSTIMRVLQKEQLQSDYVIMLLGVTMQRDFIIGVSWFTLYDAADLPSVVVDAKMGHGFFYSKGKPKKAWETWKEYSK